jgi:hypothetical protein
MNHHLEHVWTKRELLDYYQVSSKRAITHSGQYVGGILIMQKKPHTMRLFERLVDDIKKTPTLLTDAHDPDIQDTHHFREHRHGQSMLSVLRKIMGSMVVPDNTYPPVKGVASAPFLATRLR